MFIFDPGLTGIQGVLSILYILTVVFVCLMIVFENRNPLKTLSWVLGNNADSLRWYYHLCLFWSKLSQTEDILKKRINRSGTTGRLCCPAGCISS